MRRLAHRPMLAAAAAVACLCLAPACRFRHPLPGWIQDAPADSVAAFSGQAGWMLTHANSQDLLARAPEAGQALDLFLQKARINPATETGRLTFHFLGVPQPGRAGAAQGLGQVLIQLDQFQHPKALLAALANAFPQEGQLRMDGREWPLYVILDVDTPKLQAHLRAASDGRGRIWIGDLSALQRLASRGTLASRPDVAAAAAWISPRAPFQGYLQPEALLTGLAAKALPDQGALRDLPRGLDALLWSVTPGSGPGQPNRFELALAGSPEGVARITPWIQRLVAAVAAVQPTPGAPAPEVMQEKRRVGLRATLTDAQLKLVMEKLGQPAFSFSLSPGSAPAA